MNDAYNAFASEHVDSEVSVALDAVQSVLRRRALTGLQRAGAFQHLVLKQSLLRVLISLLLAYPIRNSNQTGAWNLPTSVLTLEFSDFQAKPLHFSNIVLP